VEKKKDKVEKKKEKNLFVKLSQEENGMIQVLKDKYSVNISQFVRNAIKDFYDEMEGK